MASTCDIYKGSNKLGSGSCEAASASITSYTGTAPINLRNVQVVVTEAGDHTGKSIWTRVQSGSGTATLVIRDAIPFVGA
jgi:hypothetical protein